ncbi:unnamed protein product [Leptosia nina]|uniref:Uncharacterized protein n=1 Tax=Leptosia nina TaxID=320188 RepID=A0AAV1JW21_9NEOP
MKYFVAFLALVAVAAAVNNKPINNDSAQVEAILAAINSPHTDPATAALLQAQLKEILGALTPEIDFGPAIIDGNENINIDPAIVPEEIDTNPAIVPEEIDTNPAVVPEEIDTNPALVPENIVDPAVVPPPAAGSALVQVIVNIKSSKPASKPQPIDNNPAIVPEETPASVPEDIDITPALVPEEINVNKPDIKPEIKPQPADISKPTLPSDPALDLTDNLN